MSNYNLFLDDERVPSKVTWTELPNVPWVIVRSVESFISHISRYGLPQIVSFDHDLADEHYARYHEANQVTGVFRYDGLTVKTGLEAAKWLVRYCETFQKPMPECYYHTRNHFGEANMREVINNFKLSSAKKAKKPLTEPQ
jgi:hypothetical protein